MLSTRTMKEAPKFESVLQSLLRKPDLLKKVLLGCLLSFVPIINLLSFGYLLRVCRGSRRHGVVVFAGLGRLEGSSAGWFALCCSLDDLLASACIIG